jgi:hypothetical protein
MKKLGVGYFILPVVLAAAMLSGCAGYGGLEWEPRGEGKMTIQSLVAGQKEYFVYYAGYAPDNPSGLLFDPRNDTRALQPSPRWTRIEGEGAIRNVVEWLDILNFPGGFPTLYRVRGPEGELYGFMYSGWRDLITKKIDEQNLYVYDLPDPPHYYDPGGDGRRPGIGF